MNSRLIGGLTALALMISLWAGLTYANNQFMASKTMDPNMNTNTSSNNTNTLDNNTNTSARTIEPKAGQPVKKFSLVAEAKNLEIKTGVKMPVWTYNGTVPGQEIRVTQGDFVVAELKNQLPDPVTIHWHGYPVKTEMDGVPGVNQDAVRPGETFTYKFSADFVGTYWYHSHQEGAKQVDKGLYGVLIVEPKEKIKVDKDFTLVLDEWAEEPLPEMGLMSTPTGPAPTMSMPGMGASPTTSPTPSMNMPGMGQSTTNTPISDPVLQEEEMMAMAYNIYTVNGVSDELIKPLDVNKGDTVRLRFINAGYRSHGVHIPGQEIRVVSTDGQDINGAGIIKDNILMISPGERYDVEFTINSEENFVIDVHDENPYNDQMKIPVNVIDGNKITYQEPENAKYPEFDFTKYGTPIKGQFSINQMFDVDYKVDLSTKTDTGTLQYTINGMVFGELPPIKIKTGNTVKLTYKNLSKVNHPMHLHGHFFEILARNGVAITGAPILKDTLLIKPNEEYTIAFKADNPGVWVHHCHELHHAAAGMMQKIEYTDYVPSYKPVPGDTLNKPE